MTSEAPSAAAAGVSSGRTSKRLPTFELAPHNCFACGSLNASGMRLDIHVERDRAWTDLVLERRFEGWDGIAHGGILATILDEVMAWSLVGQDNWGVTARLSIEFRKPVPIGQALHAEGWVTRTRRRLVETRARVVDATSGDELATADAIYLAADEARKRELQARYAFRFTDNTTDAPDHGDGR